MQRAHLILYRLFCILSLVIILLHVPLSAQTGRQLKLSWGEEMRAQNPSRLNYILGSIGDDLYTLETTDKGSRTKIVMYNEVLKLSKEAYLNEIIRPRPGQVILETFLGMESLHLLTGEVVIKEEPQRQRTYRLYLYDIDPESFRPKGDPRLLVDIPIQGVKYDGRAYFRSSPDGLMSAILYETDDADGDAGTYGVSIFDADHAPVATYLSPADEDNRSTEVEAFELHPDGTVYLLRRNNRRGSNRAFDAYYTLERSAPDGQTYTIQTFESSAHFINALDVVVLDDDDVMVAGTISSDRDGGLTGTMQCRVDHVTGTAGAVMISDIPTDVMLSGLEPAQLRRAQRELGRGDRAELQDHYLRQLITTPDGGVLVLSEQEYTRRSANQAGFYDPAQLATTYFHYNDIMVMKIGANAELSWAEKVSKRQMSVNDEGLYSSYASAYVDETLYLLFHDAAQNAFSSQENFTQVTQPGDEDGVVYLVTLDKDGQSEENIFMKNMNSSVILRPRVMQQIDADRMIIYGESRRQWRYGLLRFEELIGQ